MPNGSSASCIVPNAHWQHGALCKADLHGGLIACLPLQLFVSTICEAPNNLLLQDLAVVIDMATGLAVRGEQVTPLLSFHLYVPHLHLVLCHLSPEGKQTSCNAHFHGEYMRSHCGSAHFA